MVVASRQVLDQSYFALLFSAIGQVVIKDSWMKALWCSALMSDHRVILEAPVIDSSWQYSQLET